jgi:hypothetical protein
MILGVFNWPPTANPFTTALSCVIVVASYYGLPYNPIAFVSAGVYICYIDPFWPK